MAQHNDLGLRGEVLAEDYLRKRGYLILERNWRHGRHEIDIIASTEDLIVFVEVKTRSKDVWGNPEDAVDTRKIRRIVDAADFYMTEYDIEKLVRFDVISILMNDKKTEISHFEDAFFSPLN